MLFGNISNCLLNIDICVIIMCHPCNNIMLNKLYLEYSRKRFIFVVFTENLYYVLRNIIIELQ